MDAAARRRGLITLVGGLAIWACAEAFTRHYIIAVVREERPCLPWTVYLVERGPVAVQRWSVVAFRSKAIPHYRDGLLFAKFVAGIPGDRLQVTPAQTTVAGLTWGPINPDYARVLQRDPQAFNRDEIIPPDKFAMLTGEPYSYDSRYWGLLDQSQIVGKVIPLW